MNKYIKSTLVFLSVLLSSTPCISDPNNFSIKISSKYKIIVIHNNVANKITLSHEIYGYEVNCKRDRLIAWGKPKEINKNNPQDTTLTIASLNSDEKQIKIGFSKNIFGATFFNDNTHAMIETDTETVVSVKDGKVLPGKVDTDSGINSEPEMCSDFKYKSFRKFTE
jgi:hypothetical protein